MAKDRLFYNQFQYCIGFHLSEATCLRSLDHDKIDKMIAHRKQWRKNAQARWTVSNMPHRWQDITKKTVTDLHCVAAVLLETTQQFKLVINFNQCYVYSDAEQLIDKLKNMPELTGVTLTQATVNRPANTLKLKKSCHQYRTYFHDLRLTFQEKQTLAVFLETQANFVRLSPSLAQWVAMPANRIHGYYFVDFESSQWLTMLNLVHSGLIRKTMQILVDK